MKKRLLSILLALTMLATLLPAAAVSGAEAAPTIRIHADYRENYGTVFYAADGALPTASEEYHLRAYNDIYCNSSTGMLTFLLDPTVKYGWDGEKDDFMPADEAPNRSVSVWARYEKAGGEGVDDWVVENGTVRNDDVSLSGNLLTWNVGIVNYLELRVCWTEEELVYHTFGPDEANPIMIDVNGGGRGYRQLRFSDWIPEENYMYEPYGYGIKIRLPASTESVTFTWPEGNRLERLSADGLGEDGNWGEIEWPEFSEWTLTIQPGNNWYHVNFEFEGADFGDGGQLCLWYDGWAASIFYSLGAEAPTADTAYYVHDSWENAINFAPGGETQTVHLLFDTTQGIDWDAWNDREELVLEPRDEVEGIYVQFAGYLPDGNWYEGLIVENGVAVKEGFTFEDNVLTFTPLDRCSAELHVWWREQDYQFDQFGGTEDKPVVIDVNWWGSGSIPVPAGIAEEDSFVQEGRMRLRVSADTESLTFTWEGPLEEIGVDGLGEGYSWSYFAPEGDSYTLLLNQTNDWGDPRDRYNIQFSFPDYNWIGQDSKFTLGYDQWSGSVFYALGENEPDEIEACYAASNNDGYAFTPGEPIHFLLEPAMGIDWEEWDNGVFQLHDRDGNDLVAVEASYIDANGDYFEGTVFENGEVFRDDWSYENGVLTYVPANDFNIWLNLWWNEADRDFFHFNETEECPVLVELYWRDGGPVQLVDDVPEEDMFVQDGRMRIRVPFEAETLIFTWEGDLRELRVMGLEDADESNWSTVEPEGNTYTLVLNQLNDWGDPETRYNLEFNFVNYDWVGREGFAMTYYDWGQGSVFATVGDEVPTADADHYQPDGWDFRMNFAPDGELLPIHLLIDTSVCANFDKWEFEGILELEEKEPTGFVAVIARYVDEHFEWVEEPVFQNGTVLKEGWTYEGGILSYTPANDYNIELMFCFDEGQMALESLQRTEECPVMVEVEWYAEGDVQVPAGVDAENYVVWQNQMRIRVPFETESLTFTWDESAGINRVGIADTGLYSTWGRTAIEGTSYTLQLNLMDGDYQRDWYHVIFDGAGMPPAGSVAVVTDPSGAGDGGFNQAACEAAAAWCEANGTAYWTYTAPGDDEFDYLMEAAQAISDGFDTIVMVGFMFAAPAATLAEACPDVNFILLDAGLSDLEAATGDENYEIPANLFASTYACEQSGYLAGYAAVALGYRKLAFLGGMAIPAVSKYGFGFVQGANDAAKALNCVDDVRVDFAYCEQFFPDDSVEAYVDNWFANGTEVVFACGGGIYYSAASAAAKAGGKFIGVDLDQAPEVDGEFGEGLTLTSAMKDLGATVTDQLNKIANGTFAGGTDTLGINSEDPALSFVGLAPTTQFNDGFTEEDYLALLARIASGELTISDNLAERPAVDIFVDYNCYFGHEWGEPTYVWSEDFSEVTATRVCQNEEIHVETETVKPTGELKEPATCTAAGETLFTATFTNPAFTQQTLTAAYPAATGHTPAAAVKENVVDASCTAAGSYDEVVYCSVCTAELSREKKTIDALGHTPAAVLKENEIAPTCTEAGSYDEVIYCAICSAELSREHKTVDALGHDFSLWAQSKAPTCSEPGEEVRACSRCDAKETRPIDALGHDLVHHDAKAATCTEIGWAAYDTCTRCDYTTYVEIPATGHKAAAAVKENEVAPTCTEKGSYDEVVYCSVCNAELSREHKTVDAIGHDLVTDPAKAATCTEAGLTEGQHCTRCDYKVAQEAIPALGHSWDDGKVTTEPTATTDGVKTFTCTRCGATKTEVIPATGELKNPFVDVGKNDYFYDAVLWAFNNGVTTGLDDTHFGPYATCTRGQIVTFLWRALGEPEPTSTKNPFVDVKTTDYYYKAVLWAFENGVTTGTDATHFAPNAFCKREHAVAFLYRAAGKPEYTNKTNPFVDVSSSAYYYDAVLWAVEKNITKGIDATHFGPSNSCQRCQIVTFLYRFMNPQ